MCQLAHDRKWSVWDSGLAHWPLEHARGRRFFLNNRTMKPWAWHLGVSFAYGGFIFGYPLLNTMGFFLPPAVALTAPICCNFIVGYPLLKTMDFFLPPAVVLTAPTCCNAEGFHSWLPSVEYYGFLLAISCSSALMSEPFFFK